MRDLGIKRVFGNPGSTELPFLGDWPEDFEYILGLQEASVIGMADGFSRASGLPSFVNVHTAAGLGNALGNLYTAHKSQTPLVIMAGQQVRSLLVTEAYLAADYAPQFPQPYVKWSTQPTSAEEVPVALMRCFQTAMQPPYGSTFLAVPSDDWDKPCRPLPTHKVVPFGAADASALAQVAEALNKAKKPALVLGTEVDTYRAYSQTLKLAEQTRASVFAAPVVAATVFPKTHPQFCGFLPAMPEQLSNMLEGFDLIVVVGALIFTFYVEGEAEILDGRVNIMQLTSDPDAAARARTSLSLVGNLATSVEALCEHLPAQPDASRPAPASLVRETAAASDLMSADYVFQELAKLLPEDVIVVEEAPSHRPSLKHDLPLTIIVMNNAQYGALKAFTELTHSDNVPGMDLPGISLPDIARGYGLNASRVQAVSHLHQSLNAALNDPKAHLLDVTVAPKQGKIY